MKSLLTESQIEDIARTVEKQVSEMTDQQFIKLQDDIDRAASWLALFQRKHREQTGINRVPRINLDKI